MSKSFSVGYFPTSFPRDPVEINVFLEHILIGQILEPLVVSKTDGSIVPGVAARWEISSDSKEIRFYIEKGLKFSNGRSVTAKDVKYSLMRHISSNSSQSRVYLNKISKIKVIGSNKIIIHLESPYFAILKALSRDHLGIVPYGWKFDASSSEPFTGTGAYRAVRLDKNWCLIKNNFYKNTKKVEIKKWKINFIGKSSQYLLNAPVPDLIPLSFPEQTNILAKREKFEMIKEEIIHFFQSSAWWYPHGSTFEDKNRRILGMQAVRALIQFRIKKLKLKAATGIIPEGVEGSFSKPISVRLTKGLGKVSNRRFSFAVLKREYESICDSADIAAVEKKYDIQFDIFSFEAPQFKNLLSLRPDIVLFAFAGAFHDPEGFVTVVSSMLSEKLGRLFGIAYPLYLKASAEINSNLRDKKYKKLNKFLVQSLQMVPGWRIEVSRLIKNNIYLNDDDFCFTPKLKNYKSKL